MSQKMLLVIFIWSLSVLCLHGAHAQEIDPRMYTNAPTGTNMLGLGVTHVQTTNATVDTQAVRYDRFFDAFGKTGRATIILPYAQLHGKTTIGVQAIDASSQGLSDPIVRLGMNFYGSPALAPDEYKAYKQDLILGGTLTASIPWGEYNSNQLLNVGANRGFIQPGLGASKTVGSWRWDLSGNAAFFGDNNNFLSGNILSRSPIYSATGHVTYNFPSYIWLSGAVTYYSGGQSFIKNYQVNNGEENWLFGAILSVPINTRNAIRLRVSEGSFFRLGQNYTMYGAIWSYMWNDSR